MGYLDETIGNLEHAQKQRTTITFQSEVEKAVAQKHGQLMEQVRKLQTELRGADEYQAGLRKEIARQVGLVDATKAALAAALRREEDQILLRHTNNEQHDQTEIKLHEARDIIWDLVRNLDAADYARARKFVGLNTEASNACVSHAGPDAHEKQK